MFLVSDRVTHVTLVTNHFTVISIHRNQNVDILRRYFGQILGFDKRFLNFQRFVWISWIRFTCGFWKRIKLQPSLWFLVGSILMKVTFEHTLLFIQRKTQNAWLWKNCENVNSVWLVLIRIWFRNLVWGEFFKLNHLCSIPLNSIGTTWNYSIFRAQFSIEKFSIISLLQYLSR